jgi:Cu-Zn family superoxide dismutase
MCANAIAVFNERDVKGDISFHQCPGNDGTVVTFNLHDMTPEKKVACHIHVFSDTRNQCASLGPHFNPENVTHGSLLISGMPSHAGDLLNNITPDRNGQFVFKYYDPRIHIMGDVSQSIVGRSIVIHEGVDDLGLGGDAESLKTGNAGGRAFYALIGHSKPGAISH